MNGKSIRKERDTLKMTRKYKNRKSGIAILRLFIQKQKNI